MTLIKCPKCQTEVSDKALSCPKCACSILNNNQDTIAGWWQIIKQNIQKHKIQAVLSGLLFLTSPILWPPFSVIGLIWFLVLVLRKNNYKKELEKSKNPLSKLSKIIISLLILGALVLSLFFLGLPGNQKHGTNKLTGRGAYSFSIFSTDMKLSDMDEFKDKCTLKYSDEDGFSTYECSGFNDTIAVAKVDFFKGDFWYAIIIFSGEVREGVYDAIHGKFGTPEYETTYISDAAYRTLDYLVYMPSVSNVACYGMTPSKIERWKNGAAYFVTATIGSGNFISPTPCRAALGNSSIVDKVVAFFDKKGRDKAKKLDY